MNRCIEQEQKQEESQKKLIRENTFVSLNQHISYTKDCILSIDETIKKANSDIEKALKSSMLKKDDIQQSHTLIKMSLDNKQKLEETLKDLESKKAKLLQIFLSRNFILSTYTLVVFSFQFYVSC